MQYLITGATGDIGSRITEMLLKRGERPRIFVRDPEKARLRFGEGTEIFPGDLNHLPSLAQAMAGTDAVFLVTTGPSIPALDRCAVATAAAAGVRHIVKLSSLDVEQGLAIGAWHERGEAAIRESGIPFTFIRPSGFFSNLLAWSHSIRTESVVRSSTGGGGRPFIHSDDIAAVAIEALRTGAYNGQALALTGPEALTFGEIARSIGGRLGRSVAFEPIDDQEAGRRFRATGASAEEVEAHVALWRAIREERLATVTETVGRILGRPPIPFARWLEENLGAFQ
jgi:uncharacterized protein YbjT (DUF2867 family)